MYNRYIPLNSARQVKKNSGAPFILILEVKIVNNPEHLEAVQRMQTCIADHVNEPITLSMLAKAAGYSPYYCARIFKEYTGSTPFDYIRRLRLTKSALKLRDEKVRVVDVAFDFVFDSHEGFTRAFAKEFGLTPKRYAQKPKPIPLFLPSDVRGSAKLLEMKGKSKEMSETAKAIFVQIVERPARKLILLRGKAATHYFEYCDEVGCDVWGILSSIKEALYEPIGMWMPPNLKPAGTSTYTQGVEVPLDYDGEIPEGFEMIELPPCQMLIFQGQPYDDENFGDAIDELWQQIENFNPEIYGYEWADEDAPKFQLAPMGYRGYIEGRPVRAVNDRKSAA
jgi:AraC family transcriptional regulator